MQLKNVDFVPTEARVSDPNAALSIGWKGKWKKQGVQFFKKIL